MSDRSAEDSLVMTQRHILEAEGHIARQEALIEELDRDGHPKLAVKAREILETLKTTLRLGQEHLSMQQKMRSQKTGISKG
jgi:hypothetical protein